MTSAGSPSSESGSSGSGWADAARLALGTLTAVRVSPPRVVDRRAGGRAALLAPWVGVGLGAALAVLAAGADRLGAGQQLTLALVLATSALATRGLHLDGLADTADGLAASYERRQALAVMHRGDVGPAGLAATVLVLLVQLSAGTQAIERHGVTAIVVAWMLSRWAITLSCVRGVPGARPDGLGAMFAGTVGIVGGVATRVAVTVVAFVVLGTGLPGTYLPGTSVPAEGLSIAGLAPAVVAVVAVALAVPLLVRRAYRRLGGVTGDVLGAGVELALTAALVALALA